MVAYIGWQDMTVREGGAVGSAPSLPYLGRQSTTVCAVLSGYRTTKRWMKALRVPNIKVVAESSHGLQDRTTSVG